MVSLCELFLNYMFHYKLSHNYKYDGKLNPVITPHKTWYFYVVAILSVSYFPMVTSKLNAREKKEVDHVLWWDWVLGREISVEIVGSRLGKFEGFWRQVLHTFQAS
jgi:hypothetical protein